MSIKFWNILVLSCLVVVLASGGGILYLNHLRKEAQTLEAQKFLEQEARRSHVARLKAIEDFLNSFIQKINQEAKAYKKQRTIILNLIKPENMSAPEYIQENASLGEITYQELLKKMDDIMMIFEESDKKFRPLIAALDPEDQTPVTAKWDDERKKQSDLFMKYFFNEQALLQAHIDLLRFYNAKKDTISINPEAKIISFEAPEDQRNEYLLKTKIEKLMNDNKNPL